MARAELSRLVQMMRDRPFSQEVSATERGGDDRRGSLRRRRTEELAVFEGEH